MISIAVLKLFYFMVRRFFIFWLNVLYYYLLFSIFQNHNERLGHESIVVHDTDSDARRKICKEEGSKPLPKL